MRNIFIIDFCQNVCLIEGEKVIPSPLYPLYLTFYFIFYLIFSDLLFLLLFVIIIIFATSKLESPIVCCIRTFQRIFSFHVSIVT